MSLECPNCRERVSFLRSIRTTVWGRFPCKACGSVLGIDAKRRFLALIPWIGVIVLLLFVVRLQDHGAFALAGGFVVAFFPIFYLTENIVVIERRAFRCKGCGYDLRNLPEPRCPECGLRFDPAEKERIAERIGSPMPRSRWRWVMVLMFLVLSLGVVANYLTYRRVRAARMQRAATQPVPAQVEVAEAQPE